MMNRLKAHPIASIILATVAILFLTNGLTSNQQSRVLAGLGILYGVVLGPYLMIAWIVRKWSRSRRKSTVLQSDAQRTDVAPQPSLITEGNLVTVVDPRGETATVANTQPPFNGSQPLVIARERAATIYAGFWQRFAGSLLDWLICGAIWYGGSSLLSVLLSVSFSKASGALIFVPVSLLILTYLTTSWTRGQSLGMKAVGIRLVHQTTGGRPGLWRMLIRALLAMLFAVSALAIPTLAFILPFVANTKTGRETVRWGTVTFFASLVIFAVAVLGHLWMLWDKKRQTLQDKIGRVVVLRVQTLVYQTPPSSIS